MDDETQKVLRSNGILGKRSTSSCQYWKIFCHDKLENEW